MTTPTGYHHPRAVSLKPSDASLELVRHRGISLRPRDAVPDEDAAETQPPAPMTTEGAPQPNEGAVLKTLAFLRVQREAERRLDREERGDSPLPEILTLRDRLARPRNHPRWSIPGWQPANSRVMVAAQFKAGKTTLVGNYLRSRIDGDPWLGVTEVVPLNGTVALVDVEMNEAQLDDWLADQRIRADDRVFSIPLKGQVAAFDILDRRTRTWWATELRARQVSCLVLDCLRPVLDALALDEHTDTGRFLIAFDALLREADIPDAMVIHHMGHVGERARGDSRLRDWPDVEWRLMRQSTDPASPRFLSAYGRDVDQPEQQLAYDAPSRRLTVSGGSRQDAKVVLALNAIAGALEGNPKPRSGRALKDELAESDHKRDDLDKALHLGTRTGRLVRTPGPNNSFLYSLPVSGCPAVSG